MMRTYLKRRVLLAHCTVGVLAMLCLGCPRGSSGNSSGSQAASWATFEVFEAGSGISLAATVWPQSHPDDYETIVPGQEGESARFEGIGRVEGGGYRLPIQPGDISLMFWSPGHELKRQDLRIRRGENHFSIELRRTEVEDDRVPERIRLEVLESLPSEGVRTGS